MHTHSKVPEIQMYGMQTLNELAMLNDSKRKILIGLANIVDDLDVDDLDELVCVAFCRLLDMMVSAKDWHVLKASAFGVFGVANVVPAMLRLLVYTEPSSDPCMEGREIIVQNGGLGKILEVMERFPHSPMIQFYGVSALRCLARSKKSELIPSCGRVRDLVRKAKVVNGNNDPQFQNAFQVVSDDLIRTLSGNKHHYYYISAGLLVIVLAAYLKTTGGTAAKEKTPRTHFK